MKIYMQADDKEICASDFSMILWNWSEKSTIRSIYEAIFRCLLNENWIFIAVLVFNNDGQYPISGCWKILQKYIDMRLFFGSGS